MSGRIATAYLMLIAATGLVRAQEQTFRTVETTPGKLLRLGLVGNVTKECTPGPLPEIQVATQPSNGTLAIRSGKSKAGSLARCPNLEVPMQGIFYQANSGFTGTDQVAYVVRTTEGRTQSFTFTIKVNAQAKPQPKPQGNTDL